MSISSEEEKIDVDSRIHAAETFYSMGLLTEALEAYQEILDEIPDLTADKRKLVEDKVESIGKEAKQMDEHDKDVSDLSDKELNLIRQTLVTKGKGDVAQIISSGFALRELGLFNEALAEYEKLLATDHPKIKTALEMMECLLKTNPPEHAVLYLQEILAKNGVEAKEKASLNKKLAPELEKRGHLNLQQLFAKHAAEAEKKEGGQILQKRTGAPGAPSNKKDLADEKKSHLIAKKRGPKPETQESAAGLAKEDTLPSPSSGSKYDYLIGEKLVDLEQLQKALAMSKKMKKSVEQVLIEQFAIDKEEIGKSLTAYSGCPFKSYDKDIPIPYELIGNLKKAFLLNDLWIPLSWSQDGVEILVDDPKDLNKTDRITALVKAKKILFSVGIKEDIEEYIKHFFDQKKREDRAQSMAGDEGLDDLIPDITFEEEEDQELSAEEIVDESSSKVVRFVDQVLVAAYRGNVSDIHIEPSIVTKKTLIRFRQDGVCQEYANVPNAMSKAILSRIKIMSGLDIAERRLPQDGKIKFRRKGVPEFELRVATIPTTGGFEDAVLRILAKAGAMPLGDMGLTERNFSILEKMITQPFGLVLVVGPTGSGKTTTLHAALGHINKPGIKIWTAEDPVEITQAGLRQVEVKAKIGLDFARVMRAFLRADPDVIMIGEMRDHETAATGVEASLTGHLVFSTLHTNSAPETITRLLDMGLNPLNFSDAFRCVLAQRLIRRLCKSCKQEYQPSQEEIDEIIEDFGKEDFEKQNIDLSKITMFKLGGCDKCNGTGYKGRMGIHELMEGTKPIKKMIKKESPADELFKQAAQEGMLTLRQDGILKVLQGHSDMNEIRRVCID